MAKTRDAFDKSGKGTSAAKGGGDKPNFKGGTAINFGKNAGKINATPGSSYHMPTYGNAKSSKMKQGSC